MAEYRPDDRVAIDSLVSWDLYFNRIDGRGDYKIPAGCRNYNLLTYGEILMQIQANNIMFVGDDGRGSHARIRIVDDEVRNTLFGVPQDEVTLLTLDEVKSLLSIKTKKTFIEKLNKLVTTSAEMKMIARLAVEAGIANCEAWKVEAIEQKSEQKIVLGDKE